MWYYYYYYTLDQALRVGPSSRSGGRVTVIITSSPQLDHMRPLLLLLQHSDNRRHLDIISPSPARS